MAAVFVQEPRPPNKGNNTMTTFEGLTASELKQGNDFNFDNEDHCVATGDDDLRGGFATFNHQRDLFLVFFNGACVKATRTFPPVRNKVKQLCETWHCEKTEREKK